MGNSIPLRPCENRLLCCFSTRFVDLEDDLNLRNQIHCNLVMGLGYLGLNDRKTAERFLGKVRELDINHQGLNVL